MPKKDPNIKYEDGCPEWMMTMGDAMSLLLCFFVLLLTFSTQGEDNLMDVLGLMQGAMGVVEQSEMALAEKRLEDDAAESTEEQQQLSIDSLSAVYLKRQQIENHFSALEDELKGLGFSKHVTLQQMDEGVAIFVKTAELFEPDSDVMQAQAARLLTPFANLSRNINNELRLICRVEAGAKMTPRTWGLAVSRSCAVGDFLKNRFDFDAERLGYGMQVRDDIEHGQIGLLLMERAGVHEVSWEELLELSESWE